MLQKNLSNSMNYIRSIRHQSVTEFSEELGISRSSLQEILKGTSNPRIDTVEYIAGQLQLDPLLLLSLDREQPHYSMLIAETIDVISRLSSEQRHRFLALFEEIVLLLDSADDS